MFDPLSYHTSSYLFAVPTFMLSQRFHSNALSEVRLSTFDVMAFLLPHPTTRIVLSHCHVAGSCGFVEFCN